MEDNILVLQSGHLGDMIYSLSAAKKASQTYNKQIHFMIGFKEPNTVPGHPSGKMCMNDETYNYIKPLLEFQPYIAKVSKHNGEQVHMNFDAFRHIGLNLAAGDLRMAHGYVYPETQSDLSIGALMAPENKLDNLSDKIVINLSTRYRTPSLNYAILEPIQDKIVFVGLDDEYNKFRLGYGFHPKRMHVKDALHMAQIISSAKLFIGNQSSTFAIAEQLKVPRLLEVHNRCPNVIPMGGEGYYYQTTEGLSRLIQKFL